MVPVEEKKAELACLAAMMVVTKLMAAGEPVAVTRGRFARMEIVSWKHLSPTALKANTTVD